MKEIPVLFNGAMVRAIQDDRKTQTRRPLKPHLQQVEAWRTDGHGRFYGVSRLATTGGLGVPETDFIESPLGKPGDRLWVRETWCLNHPEYEHAKPPTTRPVRDDGRFAYYRATDDFVEFDEGAGWKPSIHMPRWAARLFADVLDVRIERLQDISEEDAQAEGFGSRAEFLAAWASIYGQKSVDANHWVFATTFRKVP